MDPEDILNESLEFMGEEVVRDNEIITYGPLQVTAAPKEGKANTLLADHLFSPSLFLAELIETKGLSAPKSTVIELGAGCALPSLLLSALPESESPLFITITDYPDDIILGNLQQNVDRNSHLVSKGCTVRCTGYDWGSDVTELLNFLTETARDGYDVMILSDLLHFSDSHDALIKSMSALLRKSAKSVVHIAAGKYTKPHVCESFLERGRIAGFTFEEITPKAEDLSWRGQFQVGGLVRDALSVRKAACRYWMGRWEL